MKFTLSAFASVLVAVANASPISELQERKTYGTTSNEYTTNGCNDVLLFFARGTGQSGNVVRRAKTKKNCPLPYKL